MKRPFRPCVGRRSKILHEALLKRYTSGLAAISVKEFCSVQRYRRAPAKRQGKKERRAIQSEHRIDRPANKALDDSTGIFGAP